jgi:hypothetical protein
MENYIIDILKNLIPKKINVKKIRNEKEFLIIRERAKKILVLNTTAREIYNLCDGKNVNEIIKNLNSIYPNVNRQKLSIDTLKCLRDLERRGLVSLKGNENEGIVCNI